MIGKIKKKILLSTLLLSFIGRITQMWFVLSFKKRITGSNNKLIISSDALFWGRGKIELNGDDNKLIVNSKCRFRNVRIEIFGNNNLITINDSVLFYEKAWLCIEGNDCSMSIGTKTTIGSADIFCGEDNTHITIGEDCMFSRDVTMNTSDFHSIIDIVSQKRINPPKDILVGNHVWIGNNAYIGKGSHVSDDCIIASRAWLSGKNYPQNTIIGGLPAKVIREGVSWSREKLD